MQYVSILVCIKPKILFDLILVTIIKIVRFISCINAVSKTLTFNSYAEHQKNTFKQHYFCSISDPKANEAF